MFLTCHWYRKAVALFLPSSVPRSAEDPFPYFPLFLLPLLCFRWIFPLHWLVFDGFPLIADGLFQVFSSPSERLSNPENIWQGSEISNTPPP